MPCVWCHWGILPKGNPSKSLYNTPLMSRKDENSCMVWAERYLVLHTAWFISYAQWLLVKRGFRILNRIFPPLLMITGKPFSNCCSRWDQLHPHEAVSGSLVPSPAFSVSPLGLIYHSQRAYFKNIINLLATPRILSLWFLDDLPPKTALIGSHTTPVVHWTPQPTTELRQIPMLSSGVKPTVVITTPLLTRAGLSSMTSSVLQQPSRVAKTNMVIDEPVDQGLMYQSSKQGKSPYLRLLNFQWSNPIL